MGQVKGGADTASSQPTASKPESFKTDQQYRAARRNLIWTSLAAVLFTFARPTTELYEFSFSSLGVGAGFHRAAFAVGFTFALIILTTRFFLETRRIIITLNSEASVNTRSIQGHEQDYSSDHISHSLRHSLEATQFAIQDSLSYLQKSYDVIDEMQREFQEIESTKRTLMESRNNFSEPLSDLNHVSSRLGQFEENPMQFYPSKAERSEISSLRSLMIRSTSQLKGSLEGLYKDYSDRKRPNISVYELDEKFMRIDSILKNFDFHLSRVELLTQKYDSILANHGVISKRIRREEKLLFYLLDQALPYSLAIFGFLGCVWWIVAWWQTQ